MISKETSRAASMEISYLKLLPPFVSHLAGQQSVNPGAKRAAEYATLVSNSDLKHPQKERRQVHESFDHFETF